MNVRRFLLSIATLLSTICMAQQSAKSCMEYKQIPQGAQLLELASKLVAYGRESKSALPLIQAVQIFRQLNLVDGDSASTHLSDSPYNETSILKDAKTFADGNKIVLSLIQDTQKASRLGAWSAPRRYLASIGAREMKERKLRFKGGEFVRLVLDGQAKGVTSVDEEGKIIAPQLLLTVYDHNRQKLAEDKSKGTNCVVTFIPRVSENATIEVKNLGEIGANYVLYIYQE